MVDKNASLGNISIRLDTDNSFSSERMKNWNPQNFVNLLNCPPQVSVFK
jgi:hypothetical protein